MSAQTVSEYVCSLCGKAFSSSMVLNLHMRQHQKQPSQQQAPAQQEAPAQSQQPAASQPKPPTTQPSRKQPAPTTIHPEAKEEAERKTKEEADRKAKEEADCKAKEEADCKAKEETDRKAKEEADRKGKEEADHKAKAEADRKAKEAADRRAKEEADRKVREEGDRKAKETADRNAKVDADHKAKEEADHKSKEEADRKSKEEANRKAQATAQSLAIKQLASTTTQNSASKPSRSEEASLTPKRSTSAPVSQRRSITDKPYMHQTDSAQRQSAQWVEVVDRDAFRPHLEEQRVKQIKLPVSEIQRHHLPGPLWAPDRTVAVTPRGGGVRPQSAGNLKSTTKTSTRPIEMKSKSHKNSSNAPPNNWGQTTAETIPFDMYSTFHVSKGKKGSAWARMSASRDLPKSKPVERIQVEVKCTKPVGTEEKKRQEKCIARLSIPLPRGDAVKKPHTF